MPIRGAVTGSLSPVVLVADHALIAEAVGVALAEHGLTSTALDWGDARQAQVGPGAVHGLLMTALDTEGTIVRARRIVDSIDLRWFALTQAPPGPLWGALLDGGVEAVLPSSTPLGTVCAALREASEWADPAGPLREELIGAWRELWAERADMSARLATLSPREAQVLRLLYRGDQVVHIALQLGVTPATVRSQVKALLRKLGVNSQLSAVAAYAYAGRGPGRHLGQATRAASARIPRPVTVASLPNLWETSRPSIADGVCATTLSDRRRRSTATRPRVRPGSTPWGGSSDDGRE